MTNAEVARWLLAAFAAFVVVAAAHDNGTCIEHLQDYATRVADVVSCAAAHARPFAVCENCVLPYDACRRTYDDMMKADGGGCRDVLLNSDKIQVVRLLSDALDDIWKRSYCSDCFVTSVDGQGKVSRALANDTATFVLLANNTTTCMMQQGNVSVCQRCASNYKQLNEFYNTMSTPVDERCMDTVDKMNVTRLVWSKRLHCVNRSSATTTVLILSTLATLLPVVFYVVVWLQADKQEHRVLPQKRLVYTAGSFSGF